MAINFPVPFTKMSGAGNDFIVIDHRVSLIPEAEQAEFVRKVCRRMFSVGADGLILIENSELADFRWRFYNGDGSVAEMCGNGARCAARFAHSKGIAGASMSFETLAGIIKAEISDDNSVRLRMTAPSDFKTNLSVVLDGQQRIFSFVNSGVPHAVLFIEEDDEVPVREWGKIVRFHPLFQPAGTNVNFVQKIGENSIRVRTYERGVEDETMACGTGAVASALFAAVSGMARSPVAVTTSGGERLTILFDLQDGPQAENVFLQGPARIIYDGNLTAEALL
ncbi:MAG: diaminopimelate epimerase [Proteobacteria bacterium]|nr:diaminopimelate epimerase [Pseudomonadota bacterium]MBU1649684.1 diaminopimelate epimerase [Pseudomonadota bacterium]MBU1986181.1 diaminopimelate epimerase [Pseudomonadota bacterium]